MKTKNEIREIIQGNRRGLDPVWVDESSGAVERRVADLIEFRKAAVVAAYVALRGEVRTDAIVERCWRERKAVCVPAYRPEIDRYQLAAMCEETRMTEGPLGVLEPGIKKWIPVDQVELVLVPGLAFDSSGGRVGHGKGYYDRMLEQARAGTPFTVALAFEFQVLDHVPMDPTDVRMDVIVTERRVIRARSAASAI